MIEGRLRELGMSQAQLGQHAFGKADNTAIQSLKKGSSPAIDRLEAMAKAIGWEVYFGPPRRKPPASMLHLAEPGAASDLGSVSAFRGGYLPLPWLEPVAGSGSAPVAFSYTWLEQNGLVPDDLACLLPDDVLIAGIDAPRMLAIVDRAAPRSGYGIWAIREGSARIVARALINDSMLVIQPPDLTQPPRPVADWKSTGTTVLGRVVWIGHRPGC